MLKFSHSSYTNYILFNVQIYWEKLIDETTCVVCFQFPKLSSYDSFRILLIIIRSSNYRHMNSHKTVLLFTQHLYITIGIHTYLVYNILLMRPVFHVRCLFCVVPKIDRSLPCHVACCFSAF